MTASIYGGGGGGGGVLIELIVQDLLVCTVKMKRGILTQPEFCKENLFQDTTTMHKQNEKEITPVPYPGPRFIRLHEGKATKQSGGLGTGLPLTIVILVGEHQYLTICTFQNSPM